MGEVMGAERWGKAGVMGQREVLALERLSAGIRKAGAMMSWAAQEMGMRVKSLPPAKGRTEERRRSAQGGFQPAGRPSPLVPVGRPPEPAEEP